MNRNDELLLALAKLCPHPREYYVPFKPLQDATGYDRKAVRRSVRALARKGLAEYSRGLWTEDGEPAGAGYCLTDEGIAAARILSEAISKEPTP